MRFIRKHGRIIPIRDKNEQDKNLGKAQVASAAGLSVIGGGLAGIKLRQAENIHQASFEFMEERRDTLPKGIKDVAEGFSKANARIKFTKRLALGTRWAASAVAFAGVHNILKHEKDSEIESAAKIGAAGIASELVTRSIYAGFHKKIPFRMPINSTLKTSGAHLLKLLAKKAL